MTEKKCKICGEWVNSKKIAMHYWNEHHEKYADYKNNEETRELVEEAKETKVEEPKKVEPVKPQKKIEVEVKPVEMVQEIIPESKEIEVSVPKPIIETETVDNAVKKTEEPKIDEATMWLETAKYFEEPVKNEAKHEIRQVNSVYRDSETFNEWCN